MGSFANWMRSWRLVSWRSAVVAAIVLYALSGLFVVPWIVKRQIEKQSLALLGRQATVEKVRCNPFALSLTIEGFSLPDRPGSVLLAFDRFYANAQISSLFRWAATLKELRIENPYFALRRFEDGVVNVQELLEALDSGEPAAKDADAGGLPRAVLQAVHVADGRIEIEDRKRPEPLRWQLGPSRIELSDISTIPDHEGSNDLVVMLPEGGSIKAQGKVVVDPLGLAGTLALTDARLPNLWRAIAYMFEFELTSGTLDFDLSYRVGLADDGLHVTVESADVVVADVGLRWPEHDVDLLQVRRFSVSGGYVEWPEQNVAAEAIVIEGATAFSWLEPDGTPSWDVLVPKESQEQIVETYRTLEERLKLHAECGRFELRDSGAEFEDRTFPQPVRFTVHDADMTVSNISTEEATIWPFELSATIEGEAQASAKGKFGAAPLTLEVEVGLENFLLAKYQPYIARFAPLDLRAGALTVGGTARLDRAKGEKTLNASFEGDLGIAGLDLQETVTDHKLLGWGDLTVGGIDATLLPEMSAKVGEVDIRRAGVEIHVDKAGKVSVLELVNALSKDEPDETATEGAGQGTGEAADSELPSIRIGRVRLRECYGVYTDESLTEPFTMALDPVNGTISDLVTRSGGAATVDVEAEVSSGGLIRVDGELDPLDYTRLMDLSIDVRDVLLPPVSPMAVRFVGHPIVDGDAALDLDYHIADRYLEAKNHIEADDLALGDKVEGQGQINLPVKLGVSLLKDKEGRITLDIPFQGSFDTPGFGVMTAAGAASKEVFSAIVKSPFKLLGKLAGGGGDRDLEYVEFAAGSAVLGDRSRENLDTLAAALTERPTLALGIVGASDPDADALALKTAAYTAALMAQGVTEEQLETGVPLEALEAVYRSTATDPALEALREQHTTAAADGAAAGTLDESAYRRALREALIASQTVAPSEVQALAPQRAEAIRAYLVEQSGLEAARVNVVPKPSTETGSGKWVRCRLELKAH